MTGNDVGREPRAVLAAWGLEGAAVTLIEVGNINRTFAVDDPGAGRRYVLQRVNEIFAPEVQDDIEAVTTHLAGKGLPTPRLVRTTAGALWTAGPAGGVWRLLTYVEGVNTSAVTSPAMVRSAGELLGRFHGALEDFRHDLRNRRPGVHDTPRHVGRLRQAIAARTSHPAHGRARAFAERILAGLQRLPPLGQLPARLVHGDPKINNVIFDGRGDALCLIDLDTVARMPIPVELGDAFRSWCNPLGEDATEVRFDLEAFAAGLEGYARAAKPWLTPPEVEAIPAGVETITLELAARFCADAVEESYFGWNRQRFAAAWEHHLLRAEGQLRLAESFATMRQKAEEIVRRVF